MSVPSKVKFHITEAGPKKCVALIACPKSPEEAHYDNYLDAARAYEAQLAEANNSFEELSKPASIEYEDLLIPQDEDVENATYTIKDYFYKGAGPLAKDIGKIHRDLWFDNQVENVADVSSEDLDKLEDLRAQRVSADALTARQIDDSIEEIVSEYRNQDVSERYSEFLDEQVGDSPEIAQLAWKIAEPQAKTKVFARALENRVSIPAPISREFERIWNADEFTPGSQKFMEKTLATTAERRKALIASKNQEALANEYGFANAKQAMYSFNVSTMMIRKYHRMRGRNNPVTVDTVVDKLGLFKD